MTLFSNMYKWGCKNYAGGGGGASMKDPRNFITSNREPTFQKKFNSFNKQENFMAIFYLNFNSDDFNTNLIAQKNG